MERGWPIEFTQKAKDHTKKDIEEAKSIIQNTPIFLYDHPVAFSALVTSASYFRFMNLLDKKINTQDYPFLEWEGKPKELCFSKLEVRFLNSSRLTKLVGIPALMFLSTTALVKSAMHSLLVHNNVPHSHEGSYVEYNFLKQDKCIEK